MKNNKIKTKFAVPLLIATLLTGVGLVGIAGVASAQSVTTATPSTTTQSSTSAKKHSGSRGQGVMGTVASVSGTTITVTGKNGTTYTVDASSAKFSKSVSGAKPTAATVANIAVGDTVRVNGTVSGTSVVAKNVMDGAFTGGFAGHAKGQGVMGTVASVSGTTITVTGKNGTTYTVDASSAKFSKSVSGAKPTAATVANIAVGDTVRVNGTVSGTSVVAKSVMDGAFTARVHTSSPKKTTTTQ